MTCYNRPRVWSGPAVLNAVLALLVVISFGAMVAAGAGIIHASWVLGGAAIGAYFLATLVILDVWHLVAQSVLCVGATSLVRRTWLQWLAGSAGLRIEFASIDAVVFAGRPAPKLHLTVTGGRSYRWSLYFWQGAQARDLASVLRSCGVAVSWDLPDPPAG